MKSAIPFAVLMVFAWSQLAQAQDIPDRWACDDGLAVQISAVDRSLLIRFASGGTHRLPLVSEVSGNLTWNRQGSSLCDNVKELCAFSGSGEDRMFLFVFANAGEEPSACYSLD